MAERPGRRAAIVAGLRTPFEKSGTVFKGLTALDLGRIVVSELVQRCELPPKEVEQIVFGVVIPIVQWPNIAREVGLAAAMSDVPISYSRPVAQAVVAAAKGKTLVDKLKAFREISPRDLLPVPPAIAEYSTGMSMGESAEKMAKENGITREAQDAWAHRSHTRAARAWADGSFRHEVMRVLVPP